MTIKEARDRKRAYKRILKNIENGQRFIPEKDIELVRLSLIRSYAIEMANINDLKKKGVNE